MSIFQGNKRFARPVATRDLDYNKLNAQWVMALSGASSGKIELVGPESSIWMGNLVARITAGGDSDLEVVDGTDVVATFPLKLLDTSPFSTFWINCLRITEGNPMTIRFSTGGVTGSISAQGFYV